MIASVAEISVNQRTGLIRVHNYWAAADAGLPVNHEYQILRMSEVPAIHVEVVASGPSPTMVGELGVPGTGPAVANAFFAFTGKRLYHMPFTPQRVQAALKA